MSPVVGRTSPWAEASVTFSVSLRASFVVDTKKTLPFGVVTTLETTGLVDVSYLATSNGVTGLNGLSVGCSASSFLVNAA